MPSLISAAAPLPFFPFAPLQKWKGFREELQKKVFTLNMVGAWNSLSDNVIVAEARNTSKSACLSGSLVV